MTPITGQHRKSKQLAIEKMLSLREYGEEQSYQHGLNKEDDTCVQNFNFKRHLTAHALSKRKVHACDLCAKSFTTVYSLSMHKKSIHFGIYSHACTKCERGFNSRASLESHLRTHTGERPFVCDLCNKPFSQSSSLNLHKKTIHHRIHLYTCEVCDRGFSCISNLKRHVITHMDEKNEASSH